MLSILKIHLPMSWQCKQNLMRNRHWGGKDSTRSQEQTEDRKYKLDS